MKSFFLICAVFELCVCSSVWQLRSQTTADVNATVQFSNGQTITVTDFSNPIGLQSGETVTVTIQFTSDDIGQLTKIEAPDGGSVSLGSSVVVVPDNGNITFDFSAPAAPGQKAVTIQVGSKSLSLAFFVLNSGQS